MNWLRSLFAWETVFRSGVFEYQENAVTGARRAYRWCGGGYSPIDMDWLYSGNVEREPKISGIPASRSSFGRYYGRPWS